MTSSSKVEEVAATDVTAALSPLTPFSSKPPPSLEENACHQHESDNALEEGPRKRAKICTTQDEQLGLQSERNNEKCKDVESMVHGESSSPHLEGDNDKTTKKEVEKKASATRTSAKRPKPQNIYSNPGLRYDLGDNTTSQRMATMTNRNKYYADTRNDYEQRMRSYQQYQWAEASMRSYKHAYASHTNHNSFTALPGRQIQWHHQMANASRVQNMNQSSYSSLNYLSAPNQIPQQNSQYQMAIPWPFQKEKSIHENRVQQQSPQLHHRPQQSTCQNPTPQQPREESDPSQLQSPQHNGTETNVAHSHQPDISLIRHQVLARKKFCNVVVELPPLPQCLLIALENNHHIGLPELKAVSPDSIFHEKIPAEFCNGSWIVSMSSEKIGTVDPTSVEMVVDALGRSRSDTNNVKIKFRLAKMIDPLPSSKGAEIAAKDVKAKQNEKKPVAETEPEGNANPGRKPKEQRDEAAKQKKIALLDYFSDPTDRPMKAVLRDKNQEHMYSAVYRYVKDNENKRLRYLADNRHEPKNRQEAVEFINKAISVEVEHCSLPSEASKRALAFALGRDTDNEKITRSFFWDSPEAARLFGVKIGFDARKTLQERIDLLKKVNEKEENYKIVLPNDETLKLYIGHDIHLVRQKAQFLAKAYIIALEKMDETRWTECCEIAIKELNDLGISSVKRGKAIQVWNAEFRKDHKFAHAGIIEKRSERKISKTLFFDYFPLAKDLFLEFINDNKHRITIKFVRDGFAKNILPEIEKHSRENGTFGNDSPEQKLLARLLASPPAECKISAWMHAFNIEWDHRCTTKGEAWGIYMKSNKKSPIGGYGGFGNNVEDTYEEAADQDDVNCSKKKKKAAWESYRKRNGFALDIGSGEMVSVSDDAVDAEE